MCEPVSIAAITLSAVSSGMAMAQQSANARAEQKYQEQVHAQNTAIAEQAARINYIALGQRVLQEREATAQGIFEVSQRALAGRATARVAAGEAGTQGQSVDALLGEFRVNEARHEEVLRRNLSFTEQQAGLQAESIRSGQQAQVLSTLPQPVAMPNFATGLLRIGTDAVGQFVGMTERTPGQGFLGRSFR